MNKRQRKKLEAKRKFKLLNVPHFSPSERVNLFYTFSVYISAGLKDFLSHEIHGIPCEFSDEELPFELEMKTVNGETGEKAWRATIEKMLWSFEQIRDNGYPEYDERIQDGLNLFAKYFQYLWD